MGIKKLLKNQQAAGEFYKEFPGTSGAMESLARVDPQSVSDIAAHVFRTSADAEREILSIRQIGPDGTITTREVRVIDSELGAEEVTVSSPIESVDLDVFETGVGIKHRCSVCGGYTASEIRDAITQLPLCRIHARPHPFQPDAFISPFAFEQLKNDAWAQAEHRVAQWKARRMAARMQKAELQKRLEKESGQNPANE